MTALVRRPHGFFPCIVLAHVGGEVVVSTRAGSRLRVNPDDVVTAEEAFAAADETRALARRVVTPPAAPALDASQPVATIAESSEPAQPPASDPAPAADTSSVTPPTLPLL